MEQTAREIENGGGVAPAPLVFEVSVPVDYTMAERKELSRLINEALIPVVQDAKMDIDTQRTTEGLA